MVNGEGARILIAIDDYLEAEQLRGIIRGAGHWVAGEVESGLEAIEAAGRLAPDLIIMDEVLPDLSGATASMRIQQRVQIPVVLLTRSDRRGAVSYDPVDGVVAYLGTPPRREEIERAARALVGPTEPPQVIWEQSDRRRRARGRRKTDRVRPGGRQSFTSVTEGMQEKVALLDRYLNSLIERQAVVPGGRRDQQGDEPSDAALSPAERRAFIEDVLRPT